MKLFCEKQGQGPALIMAHGIFGSYDNLGAIAKLLVDDFTLYRVDLRNHGRSPHADSMTFPEMAADIVELMDDHQLNQAIVLGHSLGGKTMMELACTHPDRVSHLIVGDIAPVEYPSHHDPILEGLQSIDLSALKTRGDADKQLQNYVDNLLTRQFLLKNLQRNEDGKFVWRINLKCIVGQYPNLRLNVGGGKRFDGPTLFIRGELSKYIQERNYAEIKNRFPNANIETLSNASHWLHAEKPDEFAALVKQFIQANK